MKNILLVGFKKSGKSTLGALVAQKMQLPFFDTDLLVEDLYFQKYRVKNSCFEIFQNHKEPFFRDLEKEAILSLEKQKDAVIATGGGSLLREENVQIFRKNGLFIFLDAPLSLVKKRLGSTSSFLDHRPNLGSFFRQRRAHYLSLADVKICVGKKSKATLVQEILGKIDGKQ